MQCNKARTRNKLTRPSFYVSMLNVLMYTCQIVLCSPNARKAQMCFYDEYISSITALRQGVI